MGLYSEILDEPITQRVYSVQHKTAGMLDQMPLAWRSESSPRCEPVLLSKKGEVLHN